MIIDKAREDGWTRKRNLLCSHEDWRHFITQSPIKDSIPLKKRDTGTTPGGQEIRLVILIIERVINGIKVSKSKYGGGKGDPQK